MSIADFIINRITRRAPDVVIGEVHRPYLLRWWVIPRNPVFNVYLHRFMRSDDDRALHDHPWSNLSILLRGSYGEHTIALAASMCAQIARLATGSSGPSVARHIDSNSRTVSAGRSLSPARDTVNGAFTARQRDGCIGGDLRRPRTLARRER